MKYSDNDRLIKILEKGRALVALLYTMHGRKDIAEYSTQ